MKTWLAAAAKLLAEFAILLAFLSASAAFAATIEAPGFGAFAREAGRAALVLFPWALAPALGIGIVTLRSEGRPAYAIFLSACAFGFVLVAAGVLARASLSLDPPPSSPGLQAAMAVERDDRLVSAAAIEGSLAKRVVTLDWSAPHPSLRWSSSLALDASGTVKVGGLGFSLVRPSPELAEPLLPIGGGLPAFLEPGKGGGILADLAEAFAFVLLAVGLALPSLRFRWPLAATTFALLAVGLAVALALWLGDPGLRARIAELVPLEGITADWLTLGLEGIAGLLVGALGILLARGVEE